MTAPQLNANPRNVTGRVPLIDMARGVALIAMAIYHFTWDMEFFGYVERGMTAVGGWKIFARSIASSFLFLVGVSLYLASRDGIRWPAFWRRWFMVVVAALAISIVTWFATPDTFIFYGILHAIALASLAGLLFVQLPAGVTLLAGAAIVALPFLWRTEVLDPRYLAWIGLALDPPKSNDFVPVFPWLGVVLFGIAAAKISDGAGGFVTLQRLVPQSRGILDWFGRHSLAFYLIHQPVLIALVWTFAQFMPANVEAPEVQFRRECEIACGEVRGDAEYCTRYCGCMLEEVQAGGEVTEELRNFCTMSSEPDALGNEGQVQ